MTFKYILYLNHSGENKIDQCRFCIDHMKCPKNLVCFPQVLDRNFDLGNKILPITLLLLQYGPSPQRYASDYQPPNYTLWYLEPHTRLSWLHTLLVILYKVGYTLRYLEPHT